ncbi:WhiB family transcriptional regulator [Kineosporia babensis]
MSWQAQSACLTADPDVMASDLPDDIAVAKGFCAVCPVLAECREWNDSMEKRDPKCNSGTFAGEDAEERAVRRRRVERQRREARL